MRKMVEWSTPEEFFATLNKLKCKYAVLRNYENFFDELLIPGHGDIDLICENKIAIVKAVGAIPQKGRIINTFNYQVKIAGVVMSMDLRAPGDGYYDYKWSKQMLKNRVKHEKGFYVLDAENYFYSLIYHAVFQKPMFAQDYIERLSKMRNQNLNANQLRLLLENYMEYKGYKYTYSYDPILYLNFDGINSKQIYKAFGISVIDGLRKAKSSWKIGGGQ